MTYARQLLVCDGTPRYPGCGLMFEADNRRQRFCPTCAGLDRPSSFVFVERRRALEAQRLTEQGEE